MTFEYNDYYNKLYEMPLLTIIMATLMIVGSLTILSIYIRNKHKITLYVIGLFLVCILSSLLLISGLKGFVPDIRNDDPSNSIQLQGVITEIQSVNNPPRFYYENSIVIPKLIIINNISYYCMTVGSINVGDNVEIAYLENSKVVISINTVE